MQSLLQQMPRKSGEVEVDLLFEVKGVGAGALTEPGTVSKNSAMTERAEKCRSAPRTRRLDWYLNPSGKKIENVCRLGYEPLKSSGTNSINVQLLQIQALCQVRKPIISLEFKPAVISHLIQRTILSQAPLKSKASSCTGLAYIILQASGAGRDGKVRDFIS